MKPHYLHNNMRELLHSRRKNSEHNEIPSSNNSTFVVPHGESGRLQVPEYQQDNLFLRQQQQQQQRVLQQQQQQKRNSPQRPPLPRVSSPQQHSLPLPHEYSQHLSQQSQSQLQLQPQRRRASQLPPRQQPQQPRPSSRSTNPSSSMQGGRRSSNFSSQQSVRSQRSQRSQRTQRSSPQLQQWHQQQPQQPNNTSTNSSPTATMTITSITDDSTTVAVPSYVPTALSKGMSDDEASWISGVESHARSAGGGASISSAKNPYLRDGRATKNVIDELHQAEDPESILTALSIVCVEFDHNVTIKHNAELYFGAIRVLSHKLRTVDPRNHDALRMICSAMEMAFRGGAKYVNQVFYVSAPILMPPLMELLDRCEKSQVRWADEIILNITKILHYLSRIPELRLALARQAGILECLQRVATAPLNVPSRNARARIIANLANTEDNKVLMFAHKGMLSSLLKLAQLDPIETTREYASVALMYLASASSNQIPLAKSGHVLKALTTIVATEKSSTIREHATTSLQNLAFPKSNRRRLVEFHNGVVVEALSQQLQNDENEKARRRAAGALTNLVFSETAERMAAHPNLLSTLAMTSTQDNNEVVRSRACLALTKIASSISHLSPYHTAVMDALVIAAQTDVDNNISAVFRLRVRETACRESMARHPGVLDALAHICTKPAATLKDRDNATRALMHLANENANRRTMCNANVLDAFVQGASCGYSNSLREEPSSFHRADTDSTGEEHLISEIRDSAIRAIARLATEVSNRPTMAKHEGLLTAIAKATEQESKQEVEQGSGNTKADAQQGFLGKPLLMSLLVAM